MKVDEEKGFINFINFDDDLLCTDYHKRILSLY